MNRVPPAPWPARADDGECTPHAMAGFGHAAAGTAGSTPALRKTLHLAALLGDAQGIDIDHNGHVYRLQITKAGKLILTK